MVPKSSGYQVGPQKLGNINVFLVGFFLRLIKWHFSTSSVKTSSRNPPQNFVNENNKTNFGLAHHLGNVACCRLLGPERSIFFISIILKNLVEQRWLKDTVNQLIRSPVKFQVTGAMLLVLIILSIFDQNVTSTEFNQRPIGIFCFFLPMNNTIISEYFCVKVLVAAVRLLVSNHIQSRNTVHQCPIHCYNLYSSIYAISQQTYIQSYRQIDKKTNKQKDKKTDKK